MAFAAATLVVVACGPLSGIASADPPVPPSPGPLPGPPASGPAAAAPQTAMDHDGTYAVGADITPGTYSSPGPVTDSTCYWKRVGSDGNTVDNAMTKKAQVVQIDASDKSFKTTGCQAWQMTTDTAPPPLSRRCKPGFNWAA